MANLLKIKRWLEQTQTELDENFVTRLKKLAVAYKKTI